MVQPAAPRTYRIREIRPDDREALLRFYASLSPESRQARFHAAAPQVGEPAATYFCGPDHAHREGLVAEALDAGGRTEIIGHLCLEPLEPGVAEMAIAVADAWQRRGVGRALLAAAGDWARAHGIATLSASMLWGNAPILGLVRAMGCPISFGPADGGTVEARVRIGDALPSAA
jgi:GNAT superfamily N-acetyltransferase